MRRLPMRKISEVLRMKASGLSTRKIAASLSIGQATVIEYLKRAERAGLSWPLPEAMSEADLERRLFAPALWGALGGARGSEGSNTPALDRTSPRRQYQTTPDGVISG